MRSFVHRASRPSLSLLPSLGVLRVLALFLSVMLVGNSMAFAAGGPLDPVKLKQTLTDRGIGKSVKVKELSGTTISGIVTGIHDDSLDVTPSKTVQPVTIPYAQVASVHNSGMSTGAKVGIGIAIGVVAVFGYIAIAISR
jgi:hypothetical protein